MVKIPPQSTASSPTRCRRKISQDTPVTAKRIVWPSPQALSGCQFQQRHASPLRIKLQMVSSDVYDDVRSLHVTIDQASSYRQHDDARGCAHADAAGHHAHAHENKFFRDATGRSTGRRAQSQASRRPVPAVLHFWLINGCPPAAIDHKKPAALAHDRRSSKMCFAGSCGSHDVHATGLMQPPNDQLPPRGYTQVKAQSQQTENFHLS